MLVVVNHRVSGLARVHPKLLQLLDVSYSTLTLYPMLVYMSSKHLVPLKVVFGIGILKLGLGLTQPYKIGV